MTRINTIDPSLLLDQHLLIEYREITRVAHLARPLSVHERVPEYVLGTGHVKFFYDKSKFLHNRCEALKAELIARGYNITDKVVKQHAPGLDNDWVPDRKSKLTNLLRLQEKLTMRPAYYKLRGQPVSVNYYQSLFDQELSDEKSD